MNWVAILLFSVLFTLSNGVVFIRSALGFLSQSRFCLFPASFLRRRKICFCFFKGTQYLLLFVFVVKIFYLLHNLRRDLKERKYKNQKKKNFYHILFYHILYSHNLAEILHPLSVILENQHQTNDLYFYTFSFYYTLVLILQ